MEKSFRFAIVGTGDIAGHYMRAFQGRPDKENIGFAGAWDLAGEKARDFVREFGGRCYLSLDELLDDRSVDAVINLTSPKAHVEISSRSLEAGKHVLSEKPLALAADQGQALLDLARSKKVTLACSPFIILGYNQQKVIGLLGEGRIGRPVSATAEMFHGRVETWHPNPAQFYTEGGGPVLDVGPYPVSLMIAWFGKVKNVQGMFDFAIPQRVDLSGRAFQVTEFDHGVALLRFESGVIGRIAFSYANSCTGHHGIEIQGTDGSISLSAILAARGELRISKKDSAQWDYREGSPEPQPASGVDWSAGIVELAGAVRENREPVNSAELAYLTLEVCLAVNQAARIGSTVSLKDKNG